MEIISFDIETSDVFDLKPNEDLEMYAPFHVAVAGVVHLTGANSTWLSIGADGAPLKNMTPQTAVELLRELRRLQEAGHILCAWNGASFDLKWLAYAAHDEKLASQIALDLYDPMLQFFNLTGYPVGLDAVARGMRLAEVKMMGSEEAPKLWSEGKHDRVIDYVCSDARITNAIAEKIHLTGSVSWITKKGTTKSERIGKLKRVREILNEPEPDQSWMDTPIPREKFVKWISTAYAPITREMGDLRDSFLMTVEDVFFIKGRGPVATGRVERGIIMVGDQIEIIGLHNIVRKAVVSGLEMFNKTVNEAHAGDNVGIILRNVERDDLERGQMLAKPGAVQPH